MKKKTLLFLFFCGLLVLMRGVVFRAFVCYKEVEKRATIELESKVSKHIYSKQGFSGHTPEEVMGYVCEQLQFSEQASNNPNEVIYLQKANCVGYAALYCAIMRWEFKKKNLEKKFVVSHKVARLHFLGVDVHSFFSSAFFKNHDYVQIEDLESGKITCYDPSLADYLGIVEVKCSVRE